MAPLAYTISNYILNILIRPKYIISHTGDTCGWESQKWYAIRSEDPPIPPFENPCVYSETTHPRWYGSMSLGCRLKVLML